MRNIITGVVQDVQRGTGQLALVPFTGREVIIMADGTRTHAIRNEGQLDRACAIVLYSVQEVDCGQC